MVEYQKGLLVDTGLGVWDIFEAPFPDDFFENQNVLNAFKNALVKRFHHNQ